MTFSTGTHLRSGSRWKQRAHQVRALLTVAAARRITRDVSIQEMRIGAVRTCNPSIIRHDGELIVALREPTYELHEGGVVLRSETAFGSRTHLARLDENLAVQDVQTLQTDSLTTDDRAKDGLEDPRLFLAKDRLMCLWTTLDLSDMHDGAIPVGIPWQPDWTRSRSSMLLAEITPDGAVAPIFITSPLGRDREKNWMPFSGSRETIRCVYHAAEGQLVVLDEEIGSARLIENGVADPRIALRLNGWSGSSQVVEWGGGSVCVAHLAVRGLPFIGRRRPAIYLHRFLFLDEEMNITRMSRPFRFRRYGVEFCAGLLIEDDRVLMSFGADDKHSFVCETPRRRFERMLRPRRGQ